MKALFIIVLFAFLQLQAADLKSLSVLYVGTGGSDRFQHFASFLRTNFARFEAASRDSFKPSGASAFDVVVLDWPQASDQFKSPSFKCPLGDRQDWAKPTVLLGSAGLNLAVVWKVRGGSG